MTIYSSVLKTSVIDCSVAERSRSDSKISADNGQHGALNTSFIDVRPDSAAESYMSYSIIGANKIDDTSAVAAVVAEETTVKTPDGNQGTSQPGKGASNQGTVPRGAFVNDNWSFL
jgi:hypothetical protein